MSHPGPGESVLRFWRLIARQTVTNGMFLWLGAKGIRNCLRESHATIFVLAYIGYLVVGLGSILFHATLKCWCTPRGGCVDVLARATSDIGLTMMRQTRCSWWMSCP